MNSELDLIRAFREQDAAVDAESHAEARAAVLAHITATTPAESGSRRRRVRGRVPGWRIGTDVVALLLVVAVVVAVAAVILGAGGQRHSHPATQRKAPEVVGPPVIPNHWPGRLTPLRGPLLCDADLARPGAIAGVGGPPSGVFTAHSPVTTGGGDAISVTAGGLAPNRHGDVYAIWLEPAIKTATGSYVLLKPIVPRLLGVLKPAVGPDGRLAAEGLAPPSDVNGTYLLLMSLQRGGAVAAPGRTALEGFIVL